MKNITIYFLFLFIGISTSNFAQDNEAKKLLDEVSSTMTSYTNMEIAFTSSLSNEAAGIKEGDEPPMKGNIILEGEKYNLNYIGNNFIFDGEKLYVINHDEKEIAINDGDFDTEDGFIYPSKLLTFYQDGYTFKLGKTATVNGKEIQFVELTPIDSDSDIVKVELGIELKTKHIYKLVQTGANSSKTTFTITSLQSNQKLPKDTFVFNKKAYLKKNYSID
ncbi:Outer-membrane lipoprotein carrier protein [Polaribacter huanghezhanensis]|uniref:LolA family protein n=1 Tax=Polaribacter huanghezhanensis TaxID=1354726 RepID=UPI002648130E|nr:outer membrane lipoprotein carrier protein LolA [Polaribacter huanghezhanensis]WKD86400.1 Outer-membrane lipoprotein carrier protein [Polaribacter huanghezhanensis]